MAGEFPLCDWTPPNFDPGIFDLLAWTLTTRLGRKGRKGSKPGAEYVPPKKQSARPKTILTASALAYAICTGVVKLLRLQ